MKKRQTIIRLALVGCLSLLFFQGSGNADSHPYISVGDAKTKKTVLAFTDIKLGTDDPSSRELAKTISATVTSDLSFMDLFRFLDSSAFIEERSSGLTAGSFKMSDWTSIGAEFLIKSFLRKDGNSIAFEAYLYDTLGNKQILSKRYLAIPTEARMLAHTFAGEVVTALTGLPGIFNTRIAMSCERNRKKEIYVMDFDGTNVKQVTQHRSIAFSPAWNPDGTKIVYSLIAKHKDNVKNIDLYELDFTSNTIRRLSNRKGINSGAAYSPNGKKIALTMSFLGNPEIFLFDPSKDTVTRITKSLGFDVDPAWNKDGSKIAFVSSRSGVPMVFSMNADGSNIKRLTYAGKYNATPSWSPVNDKMAFAGWIDKHFDIFIMNPDGTNIERLTKDQGGNEDPNFSPDGNFIVFSSNRTGEANVYVMNVDGSFVRRLSYGMGNCVGPKWSGIANSTKSVSTAK